VAAMIIKIVSGGQSGVDRAALDFAIRHGIAHGGWCPKGRRSESGPIPDIYQLTETESSAYPVRTKFNVRDSDGTLIITRGAPQGGTRLTQELCGKLGKPVIVVDVEGAVSARVFGEWVRRHGIRVLNVAGPRESEASGIGREAQEALRQLLSATIPI
jgi:hypothetical protein